MAVHPLAGKPVPEDMRVDVAQLKKQYYERRPDPENPGERVRFGTSGHRGTPSEGSFNEAHILAVTQAICDYRRFEGIAGPLFLGKDTHALSEDAQRTALEVLAANGVTTFVQAGGGFTPTPAVSRAIVAYNRGRRDGLADGIVVTPSHNPPADGGFKYNPPHGGPADTRVTSWIEERANSLLREGNRDVRRAALRAGGRPEFIRETDFIMPYVRDLELVLDLELVRAAGVAIGVDPLGGASAAYWEPIRDRYGLNLRVVNPALDPAFGFMTLDHDGKLRMDCSSPYAMAGLVGLKDRFDVAWGNDPDADRHGIVAPSAGLMNPNHYLAVAIRYLLAHRPQWPAAAVVGKTLVSSRLIDYVTAASGRTLWEVPVGFKWFASALLESACCFGGEESAGASFLCKNGSVWTTDKDGILLGLLAAEITARTGRDPGRHYRELTEKFGTPFYRRIDAPATPGQKARLLRLSPGDVEADELASEPITAKLTRAPGNGEPIGGLKVVTESGWFAARPSGTEDVYKLYAESLRSAEHLEAIIDEARHIVLRSLGEG